MNGNAIDEVQEELKLAQFAADKGQGYYMAAFYELALAAVKLLARLIDAYVAAH